MSKEFPRRILLKKPGKHRETIILWIQGVEAYGLLGFLDRYEKTKKGPRAGRQVDPILKRWVWEIRERELDCCGEKIAYCLQRDHAVHLAPSKIYEILHEKYPFDPNGRKT